MVRQFSRGDVVGDLHVGEGVIDSCGRWIRRGVGGSTNVLRVREDRNTLVGTSSKVQMMH
jgi:hypothetical protein